MNTQDTGLAETIKSHELLKDNILPRFTCETFGAFTIIKFHQYLPSPSVMVMFHGIMWELGWKLITASTDSTYHYMHWTGAMK